MADHFLDTETRQDIPLTAHQCLEAGLTVAEAGEVWCYEVSRAVAFNLWCVAGEWAVWDQTWLVARIERLRRRWDNRPGTARRLRYRLRVNGLHGVWVAIERCMEILIGFDDPVERQQAARDLASLARHYFDFCPDDYQTHDKDALTRLWALYPEPFRSAIEPALVPGERTACDQRVQSALTKAEI